MIKSITKKLKISVSGIIVCALIAMTLLFSSCGKTEEDYEGTYKIEFVNNLEKPHSSSFLDYGKIKRGEHVKSNATNNKILNSIELEFEIDRSTKTLSGESEINFIRIQKKSSTYKTVLAQRSIQIDDIVVDADTLFFDLSIQGMGEKYEGFIFKNRDRTTIGFDKKFIGSNKLQNENPWFIEEKKDFLIFKSGLSDSLKTKFYANQKSILKDSIRNNNLDRSNKEVIENSIRFLDINFLDKNLDEGK